MRTLGSFRPLPPVGAVLASLALHAAAVGTALWISPTAPVPAVPPPAFPVSIVMLPAPTPATPEPVVAPTPDPPASPDLDAMEEPAAPGRPRPAGAPHLPAQAPPATPVEASSAPPPIAMATSNLPPTPTHKPAPPAEPSEEPAPATPAQLQAAETDTAPATATAAPVVPVTTAASDIAAASTAAAAPSSAPRFDGGGLANPMPPYPRQARRLGQEGTVLLRVRVGADGRALAVEVLASSGHELLDDAARDTVARWRFHPARQGPAAVEGSVEVPVLFRLSD